MIEYHVLDEQNVYSGTVTIDPQQALPGRGVVAQEPPYHSAPQVAVWRGDDWEILAERPPLHEPAQPSQFEKDQSRYTKRAAVKDELMAYMAADNMARVRSGVWSVADLTALLGDPAVVAANSLMGTLSFELAAQQINAATTPLLTPEIKADWVSRLQAHYYLEG